MNTTLATIAIYGTLLSTCPGQEPPGPSATPETPPGAKPPLIIPQPKSLRLGAGVFRLPPDATWKLQAASRDEHLWRAAQSAFAGSPGVFEQTSRPWTTLQIGASNHTNFPAQSDQPRWASDLEGYRVTVETNGLTILAGTAQGAFYGLQTLAQLWHPLGPEPSLVGTRGPRVRSSDKRLGEPSLPESDSSNSAYRSCPALVIEDWPAMRFRGVHWFPSASGVPMHLRLITNVFGAFKLNRSVIQCEAARWDKHPEITAPNAVSKADLRKLVEACRACGLEPIPLINVPGHAEWVFRNGSNLDFAEDPQAPYAYCVNHPKSYAFIQDVLSECLPIFESKYCHIGHDEVTMRGRFPNPDCPRCKDQTVTALVVKHANRLGQWLRERDVESMIWGDMLLGPGEAADATHAKTLADARQRRDGLDKKTVIVDWHYVAGANARSIRILREAGFRVVAASWYTPENIHHLSQAAITAGAEGLLQTSWMGYFPDERAMRSQLQQFSAFVLAAEYAWSGRDDPPTQLGYDPKAVFRKAYGSH